MPTMVVLRVLTRADGLSKNYSLQSLRYQRLAHLGGVSFDGDSEKERDKKQDCCDARMTTRLHLLKNLISN